MEDKIKESLESGPKTNSALHNELGVARAPSGTDTELDKALLRLRRAGKVRVSNGRWYASDVGICDRCSGKGWIRNEVPQGTSEATK